MFAEFDHPEVIASRDAFITASIEQRHQVHTVGRSLGIGRGIGKRHFDSARRLALHEHIVQYALLVDAFRVEHRVTAAERAETTGVELAELRLFEC